ncbi:hypothetical protein [Bosea sp. BH3]|uniref:hypothetical protein n=1 Tax=Bosea sp. BH3 TaxID=2871701 RepID=UPI0021CB0BA8|nr:hypothetical protein [Bosea sp. BH3]MCU4180660.1 hypothetical protein [Bosea sp. BH3]
MFRILLVIIVLVVGYDAVVHQGTYTREAWDGITRLTHSAVEGAKGIANRSNAA